MIEKIRVIKSGDYSIISNFHLSDIRLSWNAKGILSALLALGFNEGQSMDSLVVLSLSSDGNQNTREGIAELEKYGYLKMLKEYGTFTAADGRFVDQDYIVYEVYERPGIKNASSDPEAEILNPEDMPGKPLCQNNEEEDLLQFRERLAVNKVKTRYSEDFVEAVFRELCRRDADFRQMITAKAFEKVCSTVWNELQDGTIHKLPVLISMTFDNILLGIRASRGGGGGEPTPQQSVRERLEREAKK